MKDMKGYLFSIVLTLFFVVTSWAQTSADIFAPFVSNLQAVAEENRIVLTWSDSPDNIEAYRIYSSKTPFSRDHAPESSPVATIESGNEVFSFYPRDTDPYYFAVLGVDDQGREYPLYIPFRNITSEAVSIIEVASLEERAARIEKISAVASGEVVYISYSSSAPERGVQVYRSTSPIVDKENLTSASLVVSLGQSTGRVTDFPLPGLDYYYAIVDRELADKNDIRIEPGVNSTVNPASVSLPSSISSQETRRSSRTRPLPFLALPRSVKTGDHLVSIDKYVLPPFRPLSQDTDTVARKLITSLPPRDEMETPQPLIFPVDKSPGENPEAMLLSSILNGSFLDKEWKAAEKELVNFLAIRRAASLEARAQHYLGQVYFFQERYREAFYQFLFAKDAYQVESSTWLDAVLGIM
jgi:hypothetical protein